MNLRIFPPAEMIEATVRLPLSKSICNRLLILNALTPEAAPMTVMADCDDSRVLAEAIAARKATDGPVAVDVGAAGTAMRFFTALASALPGLVTTIDGSERMRHRPIGPLVDALRALGADIVYTLREGYPPLKIEGRRLDGGEVTIDAGISSQFISALMMVAPTMATPLHLRLDGETISTPYIKMTAELMRRAGIKVEFDRYNIHVEPASYRPAPQTIEPDWSAASYWYEVTALSAGFVTLPGLEIHSLQGDSRCIGLFERLGVATSESEEMADALELCASPEQHSRLEEDLVETPDIAQTLAVTSAMLGIPFHLRGLRSLRIKETDRLEAIRRELDKVGIVAEVRNGSELVWNGERHPVFAIPEFDTYEDHRMAMSLAPIAIFVPGIVIRDAGVVSKSYPGYWDDMRAAGFIVQDAADPIPPQFCNPEEEEL